MSIPDQPTRTASLPPALVDAVHAGVTRVVEAITSSLREGESPAIEALRSQVTLLLGDLLTQALTSQQASNSFEGSDPIGESGNPLELQTAAGGERYRLDGRPIHNGDVIEVALENGTWLAFRLEGMPRELLGYGLPRLAEGYELVVKLPPGARFRWPKEREEA